MSPGKGPLRIAIEDFLHTFGFGNLISGWLHDWMEGLEDELLKVYDVLISVYYPDGNLPYQLQPDNVRKIVKTSQVGIAVALANLYGVITGTITGWTAPYAREASYEADSLQRTWIPSAVELPQFQRRDTEHQQQYANAYKNLGVADGFVPIIDAVNQQVLSVIELETLRLRNKISSDAYTRDMHWIGMTDERIKQVQDLIQVIPPVQDLVHMADRFAFDDALAQKYHRDEEYPADKIQPLVNAQGLSTDFFKLYWRAHWQDPAVQQVFEMYHRLRPGTGDVVFDDAELKSYLQVVPLSPYWWDKLTAIAYTPITRVDIRRFYKAGVMTKDEVYNAYLDLGYNKDNAQKSTDFTTLDSSSDKQALTQSAVVNAYKRGILTHDQAVQHMTDIKISKDDAEFFLSIADYDLQAQKTDVQLQVIQQKYINGVIDELGLTAALGPLNLPSERIAEITALWNIQRENKIVTASRSELDDLLERSIITSDDYSAQLKRDGYDATTIKWFVLRIADIMKDNAAADLSSQQAEQERLKVAGLKTGYQVDHQNIVVQIAQYKSAIADLTYDAAQTADPAQKSQDQQAIATYKNAIAHLNEQAANVKLTLVKAIQAAEPPAPGSTPG